MSFKEVSEIRKSGKLDEALSLAIKDLEQQADNIWNKRSIAWVYHDYMKKYASVDKYDDFVLTTGKLLELKLPADEKMIFDTCAFQLGKIVFAFAKEEQVEYSKIDKLYDTVLKFNFTKTTDSYFYLYKAFHKHYKNWSSYLNFADWWGFENFRSEDFLTEEYNGKQIMPIAEQAYIAYSKKLIEGGLAQLQGIDPNKTIETDRINEFLPKLDKLIAEYPEYQYLPYYKAKLLLAVGDNENVLSAFIPFARQKRNDFWVWELLADFYSHDKDISFACYCKALSLKTPEDFLVKLHQKFAALLVEKEMYAEAKTEIEKLVSVRAKHEWKIPNQVVGWQKKEWYTQAKANKNNKQLYLKYSKKAEEVLFHDIPEEIIAVEFVNTNKGMLSFVKNKGKFGFFRYSNLLVDPKIGDIVSVRFKGDVQDGYYQVLTAKQAAADVQSEAIKPFEGVLKVILPYGFGFIGDVYVDAKIIENSNLTDKQIVVGKAILSFNKKKTEWGWKAI